MIPAERRMPVTEVSPSQLRRSMRARLLRWNRATASSVFFFQAEDGIRDLYVTGVQTCDLPLASTAEMIFPVARLISDLSQGTTLLAGTAIVTGTPSGVGMARKPPVWLKAGDLVEVEIDRLGILRNTVRVE